MLGFEQVYDYIPGKGDWLARGLRREGGKATLPRAVDFARHDVVTCEADAPVGGVRERVESSPYGFGLVVSAAGVLVGRLRRTALDGDPRLSAEQAMEPGAVDDTRRTPPARLRERLLSAALALPW